MATTTTPDSPTEAATEGEVAGGKYPAAVEYRYLKQRHPAHAGTYWQQCEAFYAGGQKLLGNAKMMQEVFPPHLSEEGWVYEERKKRAYYIPYAGQIIDYIVASLFSTPLSCKVMDDQGVAQEPEEFWADFQDNCAGPFGHPKSLNEHLRDQITNALVKKTAWCLVDLPDSQEMGAESVADEKQSGAMDAYIVPLDPECVVDWEEDDDGRLNWVLIHSESQKRDGLEGRRDLVTEEWTYWDREGWAKYRLTRKKDQVPKDNLPIPRVGVGTHSFEDTVPIVRLALPDGLWAMGKLESIAKTHFNKRCALTWAEYKSLFSILVAYQGSPDPLNPVTEDPNRALNQRYGQGRIVIMGEKDNLAYVGPDTAAFTVALDDLNNERDEMHRVVHQMAQSVDNSGAALQRSGASKAQDGKATAVVAAAMSRLVKEYAKDILEMCALGRKDDDDVDWAFVGLDDFDEEPLADLMATAQIVDVIQIPSKTFKVKWLGQVARRLLHDNLSPEESANIDEELEENIQNEDLMAQALGGAAPSVQRGEKDIIHEYADKDIKMEAKKAKALAKAAPKPKPGKK